jgi:hypothetical protein
VDPPHPVDAAPRHRHGHRLAAKRAEHTAGQPRLDATANIAAIPSFARDGATDVKRAGQPRRYWPSRN